MKKTFRLFAIMCVFSLLVAVIGEIPIRAEEGGKEEKIVRVVTQKQLNKALKNPDVDTVIFRSPTYDIINISSKKTKNKNLIIEAPNAFIFNYSKFKSIEIQSAKWYLENVSGNTITVESQELIQVNKGATVKEMIFKVLEPQCTVQTGAAIKTISYDYNGHKGVYDSASKNIIHLDAEALIGSEVSDISCTFTYDDYGRLIEKLMKVNDTFETFAYQKMSYDENGSLCKDILFDLYDGVPIAKVHDHVNDEYGNVVSSVYSEGESYIFEYREDQPYREARVHRENSNSMQDFECFYDENDRIAKKSVTSYRIVDGVKGEAQKYDIIYEHYKNGCLKSCTYLYDNGAKKLNSYIYDKSWNPVHIKKETYDPVTGLTSVYEERGEYDEYGNLLKVFCKYPDSDEWVEKNKLEG